MRTGLNDSVQAANKPQLKDLPRLKTTCYLSTQRDVSCPSRHHCIQQTEEYLQRNTLAHSVLRDEG
jgi:hypothetical protein